MTETKRCSQCGREGTRQFRTLAAATYVSHGGEVIEVGRITLCANTRACRRRRPESPTQDED